MAHVIALIGGGGKTTAMMTLARALQNQRVLVTTTTHIYPVSPPDSRAFLDRPTPEQLKAALSQPGIVCAGVLERVGKLSSLEPELLAQAAQWADWVVCEADGARCRPLKLHRETEPVIPPETALCVMVLGLSGVDQPVSQVVHRYELCPAWAESPQMTVEETVLVRCALDAVAAGKLPRPRYRVLLNQAETARRRAVGERAAQMLRREGLDCRMGSLREDPASIVSWLLET